MRPPRAERLLRVVLAAAVALPAFAVAVGFRGGEPVFFEYHEPKGIAAVFLASLFLALFLWLHGVARTARWAGDALRRAPELAVFAGLLGYMALSGLWVEVHPNWWYELRQYALFFALAVVVRAWARRAPGVALWVVSAVCGATGVLVAIGLGQAAGWIAWLRPIDPGYGVDYPSLLGYKNPMALAVVGQIVLLVLLALLAAERLAAGRARTLLLAGLAAAFAVECGYVAMLKSRTAYVGLAVASAALLAIGWAAWRRSGARTAGVLAPALALLLAAGALALAFGLRPDLRSRLASVKADYVDAFSTSDRATYLVNSVAMARHRPFGVGLGEWQTYYPVYRPRNPEVAFTDRVQARRAHNDHAQMLAELGVPGILLWAGFWTVLLGRAFAPGRHGDSPRSWLLGAQLLVFLVAMAGDFVLEHPYLKLQLFALLALPLRDGGDGAGPEVPGPRPSALARVLVAALALAAAWEAGSLAVRIEHSGFVRWHYLRMAERRAAGESVGELGSEIEEVLRHGERFLGGRGHSKSFFKDHLMLAETAWLIGRSDLANELAWASLELHPYNSQAFELLAEVWAPVDPARSRELERAQRHILEGPKSGFGLPYPERAALPWPGTSPPGAVAQ